MKKYYVYHIPNFIQKDGSIGKIGTSVNPKTRVRKQKYTDYEILFVTENKDEAAAKEIELQKEYGYRVDTIKYNEFDYGYWGKINGKKVGSIYGTIQGRKNVESGHLAKVRKGSGRRAVASGQVKKMQETNCKKVLVQSMDGTFSKEYDALKIACNELNLHQGNASSVARGERNSTSGYKLNYI